MKNNIILVGCMGSGKTSVGLRLSRALEYQFLDTDSLIIEKSGLSISEIFETQGEESFRQMETELLKELVINADKTVISTGGGMPMREENQALLHSLGHVVYLKASVEVLLKRVQGDTGRPLLATENREEKLKELLATRSSTYISCAHTIIETNDKSFYDIIKEIEMIIKKA